MEKNNNKPKLRFPGFTDPWEQRKLGEILDEFTQRSMIENQYEVLSSTNSGMEFREGRVSGASNKGYKIIENGDLVLSPQNLWLGNISINDIGIGLVSPSYKTFKIIDVCPEFLKSRLRTQKMLEEYRNASTQGASVVRRNLDIDAFNETAIIVPNKDEQIKIGAFLKDLDHRITIHQRKLNHLQDKKESLLQKMFPKNGEDFPELRFPGFTDLWKQRKLGELTNISSASRVHKEEWASVGVPFFRSSDVISEYRGTENEKAFISYELYEQLSKNSGKLEKDDILITGGGSIGIPYIVPNSEPLYSKDADLIWIKSSENFNSKYSYAYFATSCFRSYVSSISHIGTIAHYTIEQVKSTPVYVPSYDEQEKTGLFFQNLDNLITLNQRKLNHLKEQKKALLQQMFV